MRVGFPHSEIPGSKLVCQLPEAYRRLPRPSSPVAAKASTMCTWSLDPITPEHPPPASTRPTQRLHFTVSALRLARAQPNIGTASQVCMRTGTHRTSNPLEPLKSRASRRLLAQPAFADFFWPSRYRCVPECLPRAFAPCRTPYTIFTHVHVTISSIAREPLLPDF